MKILSRVKHPGFDYFTLEERSTITYDKSDGTVIVNGKNIGKWHGTSDSLEDYIISCDRIGDLL